MYMIDVNFVGDQNKYASGILQYFYHKKDHYLLRLPLSFPQSQCSQNVI